MSPLGWLCLLAGFAAGAGWPVRPRGRAITWRRLGRGGIGAALVFAGICSAGFDPPEQWNAAIFQVSGEASLKEFIRAQRGEPALVSFYSERCAPCKANAGTLNRLAQEGTAIAVVNADGHPSLVKRYGAAAFPTTFVLREGRVAHVMIGYHSAAEVRRSLEAVRPTVAQ